MAAPSTTTLPDARALSHDALLRSLADARSDEARDVLLAEARRRLERVHEPRARSTPWDPANGGC